MELVLGLLMLLGAMAVYVFPSIVAFKRRHRYAEAIFVTNMLLGWTFLGWCVALIWAATAPPRHRDEPTFALKPQKYDPRALSPYQRGFQDGNQGDYSPGGLDRETYDWGHADGQKYGVKG